MTLKPLILLSILSSAFTHSSPPINVSDLEYLPCNCEQQRSLTSIWQNILQMINNSANEFDQKAKEELCACVIELVNEAYTSCMIDPSAAELADMLQDIANAMRSDRVYTILLNDDSELSDQNVWLQANNAIRSVLGNRVYTHTPGTPWPTLGELKGKVVVFLDDDISSANLIPPGQLCIHASDDWIFETEYDYEPGARDLRDYLHNGSSGTDTYPASPSSNQVISKQSPDGYYCGISRGAAIYPGALADGYGQTDKMYIMHHYMTEGLAGKQYLAKAINIKSRILDRITTCQGQVRFWPTFLQVDFVNSDVTNAVAGINQQLLQNAQKNNPAVTSLDDLRYNQVLHLITHNGPINKSPGYYATHTPPTKYKNYVDRLWFAQLVKFGIADEAMLTPVAVNDQIASLSDQVNKYGVVGFKVPMVADPKVGTPYSSTNRILWGCHGLDKLDLESMIKTAFGVS